MTRNSMRKALQTPSRNVLAAALTVALWSPLLASAQDQTAPPAEQDAQAEQQEARTLDTVQVTGSRIKRSEVEGPAPVTVITGEQMKKEGFATVHDALLQITEAIGNVQNDSDWGQSSVNASPLNLRNLGPGRSLLLINGHRVADYPVPYQGKSNFFNFNNIPSGIVERIEVLSGAASAIYGSDAMGGVVNIVLKDSADEQVARVKYGEATRGGRENLDISLSGGFNSDRGSIVYNVQHFERGVLLAKDRPFMDSENDGHPIVLTPLENHYGIGRATPSIGLRLRDLDRVETVPGIGTRAYSIAPPSGACDQYGEEYFLHSYRGWDRNTQTESGDAGSACGANVFHNWALKTGSTDDSAYFYGTWDFTDTLQGWFTYGAWKSTGDFNTFLDGFASPAFWDPRANNGAGGTRDFFKTITPAEMGGEERILTKSNETSLDFSAGLRGKFGQRWDWEAMLGRATYEVVETFPTLNQGDMADFFLGPQLGTTEGGLGIYTPDYDKLWSPLDPNDVRQFSARGKKIARSYLNQAQFVVSGDLWEGWAGPIGFAGVLEAARQGYKLTPDPKTLNPDPDGWYTPFGNIEQGGGDRTRYAVGAELRVPLPESLTTTLATRYDKYDAVRSGAKQTYQMGLEWRPLANLLVRGSYGTAFRAPDMHFVYAKASESISDFTDVLACGEAGYPNNDCPRDDFKIENATVRRGGTPDLEYEEGESWSAGFVWDAFEGFSFSADYWKVHIDNIINDISPDQLLLDEAYCQFGRDPDGSTRASTPTDTYCAEVASRIQRTPGVPGSETGSVTILVNPINRAETEVAGVDVKASYRLPDTRLGDWGFNLGYTNMLEFRERGFSSDPFEDTRKNQNPRTRITLAANWSWEQWNATLLMYQKSGGRVNNWGGCMPFADGYRPGLRLDDEVCLDNDPASPTYGQTTERVYDRREPRRYFNGSVGYAVTDDLKFNLYVSNIFDKIYGDKWCGDFTFCVDDPVGREVSAEVVYRFR
jgi:outer membrane receptor protein involved in Fe transport